MEIEHRKIEIIVPEKFHWWFKVFRKMELEKNAGPKGLGPCNRHEGGLQA